MTTTNLELVNNEDDEDEEPSAFDDGTPDFLKKLEQIIREANVKPSSPVPSPEADPDDPTF